MKEFYVEITQEHKIKGEPLLLKAFRSLKPGRYRNTLVSTNKRSINQNSYVHVCFTLAQKGLYEAGYENITTMEAAKDWYKQHFLKIDAVNKQSGEIYEYVRHTSELSKDEMTFFIDRVRDYSLEFTGVYIPTPEEWKQNTAKYDLVGLAV